MINADLHMKVICLLENRGGGGGDVLDWGVLQARGLTEET